MISGKLNASRIILSDDLVKIRTELQELMQSDKQANVLHNRNIRKNGKIIFCEWYNSVLKDENGNATGIMSLVQDVTRGTLEPVSPCWSMRRTWMRRHSPQSHCR